MLDNIFKKHLIEHPEIKLNDNERVVNGIKNLLNMSKNNLGEYYCPCRPEKTKDNICPCIHHLKEIDEYGHCCCNLFLKS